MRSKQLNKVFMLMALLAIAVFTLSGCSGSDGSAGANGANGANGAAGAPGTTIGVLKGSVSGPAGALAGVVVSNNITADKATTAADGTYSISLPMGTYTLTFTMSGYTVATATGTVVAAGNTSSVSAVTLSESASGLPSCSITSDKNEVGYGNTVNLTATCTAGTNGTVSTYAWSITPPSAGSAMGLAKIAGGTGAAANTAVVTMMPMNDVTTFRGAFDGTVTKIGTQYYATSPAAYTPTKDLLGAAPAAGTIVPADGNYVAAFVPQTFTGAPKVLPISADTRGAVTPKLVVTDSIGGTVSVAMPATQPLYASSVQPGVKDVAVGEPVYLNSGHATPWAWTLTPPTGSKATLSSATGQFPMFVPDIVGAYTVKEGANTSIIYADTFKGVIANSSAASSYTTKTFNLSNPADADMSGMWYDTTNTAYWPTGATSTTYSKWPVVVPDSACTTCHANNVVVNGLTAPDKFTPWTLTAHATFFARGIDGITGNSGTCLTCHTTGYDLSLLAANGGFDDVAAANGWSYPATRVSGNWGNLFANATTQAVGRMSNIQCENCHGPQANGLGHISGMVGTASVAGFTRVDYSAENCAVCHASGTGHHYYSEWASETNVWSTPNSSTLTGGKGHNKLSVGQAEMNCGCHNAQAFAKWVPQLKAGNVEYDMRYNPNVYTVAGTSVPWTAADAQAITCTACHDPHDNSNPNQLRVYDSIGITSGGFGVAGLGKGAICVVCHNLRAGQQCNGTVVSSQPLTGILPAAGPIPMGGTAGTNQTINACIVAVAGNAPRSLTKTFLHEDLDPYMIANPTISTSHDSTAGDTFMGRNAFFMGSSLPMVSKHASVKDSCAGCHMTLNPTSHLSHGAPATSSHTFIIDDNGAQTLCANCHSANVTPSGVQGTVKSLQTSLRNAEAAYVMARLNAGIAAGGASTPYYQTGSGTVAAPYVYTAFTTVGNVTTTNGTSFTIYKADGVTVQGATATSTYSATSVYAKDADAVRFFFNNNGSGTHSGENKLFKAQHNYSQINKDFSLGVHNPTFVISVLNNTIAAMGDASK